MVKEKYRWIRLQKNGKLQAKRTSYLQNGTGIHSSKIWFKVHTSYIADVKRKLGLTSSGIDCEYLLIEK